MAPFRDHRECNCSSSPSSGERAFFRWDLRNARELGGFTLFELLLVLALIAVLGALMSPLLSGAFNRAKIHSAADDIQAVWADARLHAIEQGQPVAFRCLIGGRDFATSSYVIAAQNEAPMTEGAAGNATALESGTLDEDLKFSEVAAASATDSSDPGQRSSLRDSTEWSPPIIFYPDGRSSDALVTIAHNNGRAITVTLRGITAISQKGEVGPSGIPEER